MRDPEEVTKRLPHAESSMWGIMVACSLLYRLDEEARALGVATEVWAWKTDSGPALQAGFEHRPERRETRPIQCKHVAERCP